MKIIYSTLKHKVTSTLKLLKLLCHHVYISKTLLFLEMMQKMPLPLSFFSFDFVYQVIRTNIFSRF